MSFLAFRSHSSPPQEGSSSDEAEPLAPSATSPRTLRHDGLPPGSFEGWDIAANEGRSGQSPSPIDISSASPSTPPLTLPPNTSEPYDSISPPDSPRLRAQSPSPPTQQVTTTPLAGTSMKPTLDTHPSRALPLHPTLRTSDLVSLSGNEELVLTSSIHATTLRREQSTTSEDAALASPISSLSSSDPGSPSDVHLRHGSNASKSTDIAVPNRRSIESPPNPAAVSSSLMTHQQALTALHLLQKRYHALKKKALAKLKRATYAHVDDDSLRSHDTSSIVCASYDDDDSCTLSESRRARGMSCNSSRTSSTTRTSVGRVSSAMVAQMMDGSLLREGEEITDSPSAEWAVERGDDGARDGENIENVLYPKPGLFAEKDLKGRMEELCVAVLELRGRVAGLMGDRARERVLMREVGRRGAGLD